MLKIREQQEAAFVANFQRKFEDQMLPILREYFPGDCEVLGEAQVRKVIDLGIERAAAHGFDTKGDVCDYICLMFTFGSYFDEDPLLPWAAEILDNVDCLSPSDLKQKLYAAAAEYSGRVAGDTGEYRTRALLRARDRPFESPDAVTGSGQPQDTRSFLRDLYPQRYNELSNALLASLIDAAHASAEKYGLAGRAGFLLYAALMFMLGSHFDRDPVHPWAEEVLQDKSVTDATAKARKLHEAAMARLNQALTMDAPVERA